jgi:hypothetical protein
VCLKERAHLSVTRSTPVEDHEVKLERHGVDAEGNEDQTEPSRQPVADVGHLRTMTARQYRLTENVDRRPRRYRNAPWAS